MISCIDQGIKNTGRNETGKDDKTHLVNSYSEINLFENSMQNRLGLCYTTLLINYHCQTQGENAVISSTFNSAFRRILPKTIKNQKIQQGPNNGGKRKEARY